MTIKYKNPFIHGSLMIKKSTINDIGNYDEAFYYAQDFKLITDLLEAKRKDTELLTTLSIQLKYGG